MKSTRFVLAVALAALLVPTAQGAAQEPPWQGPPPSAGGAKAGKEADILPADPVITQHTGRFNGQTINYAAEVGWIPIRDEGKLVAKMGYIAYTKNGVTDASTRPLIISFNGGPGTASVWMHIGYTGPRRVVYDDEGFQQRPPGGLEEGSAFQRLAARRNGLSRASFLEGQCTEVVQGVGRTGIEGQSTSVHGACLLAPPKSLKQSPESVVRATRAGRVEDRPIGIPKAAPREPPVPPDPRTHFIRGAVARIKPEGSGVVVHGGVANAEAEVLVCHHSMASGSGAQGQAGQRSTQRRVGRLHGWGLGARARRERFRLQRAKPSDVVAQGALHLEPRRELVLGHTTVHVSWSQSPSQSGPSSWEQRSSIAYSCPPQL
jgi:hypothetical protein